MKENINEMLKIFGIGFLVVTAWQVLELMVYGRMEVREIDNIVGIILTLSLYKNLKTWNKGDK